ncbi:MAG: class II aldolase/adducin family protein [Candidatus Aenigmarchaeota archaeon]|nr:class II aldolase/adducin family protein [Candidatus Aenigmarchaeota archaeon]
MQEGIIKFVQCFTKKDSVVVSDVLLFWRSVFYRNGLIGRNSQLYGGAAYGNLSQRLSPYDCPVNKRRFLISGSQTSGLEVVASEHFSVVVECYPDRNFVVAEGPVAPSSESMTHGVLYDIDNSLRFVFHAHCPHIWHMAELFGIPATSPAVEYGTVEMTREVFRLFSETDVFDKRIFCMGGHQDGVVTFGRTAEEAGFAMLKYFVRY